MAKSKILIVDDSRIFRNIVEQALKSIPEVEIIGSVRNGVKAIEFIKANAAKPDIVSLDVEMDEMDGLETLKEIQKFNKEKKLNIKAVMLSAHTKQGADITIEALQAGAYDFIPKPAGSSPVVSIKILKDELSRIIGQLTGRSFIRPAAVRKPVARPQRTIASRKPSKYEAILIGVSTGGPKALAELLPKLTKGIDIPVFIVQHMPPTFTKALADSLNSKCEYNVVEASNDQIAQKKTVYIAPGGKHMIIKRAGAQGLKTVINDQPPEEGCKPSVNVMFRSAAPIMGANALAIVLTGMGSDGTKGLGPLKRAGAHVIVQDEKSSVVWGMPGSAYEAGFADEMLPINKIADRVHELVLK